MHACRKTKARSPGPALRERLQIDYGPLWGPVPTAVTCAKGHEGCRRHGSFGCGAVPSSEVPDCASETFFLKAVRLHWRFPRKEGVASEGSMRCALFVCLFLLSAPHSDADSPQGAKKAAAAPACPRSTRRAPDIIPWAPRAGSPYLPLAPRLWQRKGNR